MAPRYKLKLDKLDFCSIVDNPAQPNAKTLLIKRAAGGDGLNGPARLVKIDDSIGPDGKPLGLAFFWAFTSTNPDGTPHHDLQGDAIDQASVMKAAMDYMLAGGASDEMHDGTPGAGRVVFAMPWDPEVAKAYGQTCTQSGLMIAIKPRADVLAKLRDGTYNGVSIAGTGTREAAKRVETIKAIPTGKCADCGANMPVTVERCADCGGSMAYKRAPTVGDPGGVAGDPVANGNAPTCADCGIAMSLTATACGQCGGPPNLSLTHAEQVIATSRSADDGVPSNVADAKSPIAARAPSAKSTRSGAVPSVNPMSNEATMSEQKIADLEKQLVVAKQRATLTDAHRAHLANLTGDDAVAFLAKSIADRDAVVAPIEKMRRDTETAGNEIAYVSTSDGTIYRKRDDERMVAMAKRVDEAESIAKNAALEKRASADLSSFAKTLKEKTALLKAVDGIGDEPTRTAVIEALRGANAALKQLSTMKGVNPGGDPQPETPLAKFNAELATYAKSVNKSVAHATGDFLRTPLGADLYAETTNQAALRDHAESLLAAR